MNKRILFVDDEPLVLQGIQRMLRSMRHEWDMDFAEGGESAKALIAANAYDVVITDMMMPGIDGAMVLEYVCQQSPKTIRIVLSGHAEQHLTMRCVGIAHQYLSKPCDTEMLKRVVARVTRSRFSIENERVMTLVARLDRLPSMPVAYSRMVQLLKDPNTSMEDVGELIASDMAMTAKVLKIVNSAFFGLARHVAKPTDAASYLGLDTLKSLVLAGNVFCQFEARMPAGFSAARAAEHSQRVGAAARIVAKCENAPRTLVDEALVAGLLHDVGKLVLASNMPDEFQITLEDEAQSGLDGERAVFGTTHAEVGGHLLGLWGLPPAVVEAITLHHSPGELPGTDFSPVTAVHVADCLVAELSAAATGWPVPALDMEYLARLGLTERLPIWRDAVAGAANLLTA